MTLPSRNIIKKFVGFGVLAALIICLFDVVQIAFKIIFSYFHHFKN